MKMVTVLHGGIVLATWDLHKVHVARLSLSHGCSVTSRVLGPVLCCLAFLDRFLTLLQLSSARIAAKEA